MNVEMGVVSYQCSESIETDHRQVDLKTCHPMGLAQVDDEPTLLKLAIRGVLHRVLKDGPKGDI